MTGIDWSDPDLFGSSGSLEPGQTISGTVTVCDKVTNQFGATIRYRLDDGPERFANSRLRKAMRAAGFPLGRPDGGIRVGDQVTITRLPDDPAMPGKQAGASNWTVTIGTPGTPTAPVTVTPAPVIQTRPLPSWD